MGYKFYDRVQVTVSGTPGTGAVTVGSASTGFQSFSAAGASNGDTFPYLIVDGNNWEFGIGTYSSSGPTVTRTTMTASSSGSAISFTSSAIVMATMRAEDIQSALAGSLVPGNPPSVVQFHYVTVNATIPSVTMGSAPVSGNMLVAFLMTSGSSPATASGWTLQSSSSTGTWYFNIYTKIAGVSESTSQFPVTGGSSSYWTCGIYEVTNQNGTTPILTVSTAYNPSNNYVQTPPIPQAGSTLCLMGVVPSLQNASITSCIGCATLSANLVGAAGAPAALGWSDSNSYIYTMFSTFSTFSYSDSGFILITH